jgi:putative membrane protein
VSVPQIAPRFELESPIPRLQPDAPPVPETPASGRFAAGLWGVLVLVVGIAALLIGNFVAAQFERGPALGWLTLAVAGLGLALIATALGREARGLLGLRRVDRLRAALADPTRTRTAALAWLASLPEGAALRSAVAAVETPEAALALLRAGPLADLQARAEALGRAAAVQMFAATAAIPSPALDAALVAWRGARLVRQVAELHGMRPGTLATLALLRRVALGAAGVAATNLVVETGLRALGSHPLARHLAGEAAGAGVAARRMIVLARVTALACSPLAGDAGQ